MSLQDNAASRKAKLLALRKQRDQAKNGATPADTADSTDAAEEQLVKHRAYDAGTGQAKKHARDEEVETVEQQVAGLAQTILSEDAQRRQQELDLFNIQPKKPNWDLKRDVEKKMAKLEAQTQAAIAQIIRNRIAAERKAANGGADDETLAKSSAGMADLASAIGGREAQDVSDEDD